MQRLNARLPPDDLALFKQKHGWDAANLILLSSRLRFININFDDLDFIASPLRKLLQNGSLLLAGTTPVSVEIDQYRGVTLNQVFK